jgi:hypothetical protein
VEHVNSLVSGTPFGVLQVVQQQQAQPFAFVGAGLQTFAVKLLELAFGSAGRLVEFLTGQYFEALTDGLIGDRHSAPIAGLQRLPQLLMQLGQALAVTYGRH